MSLSKITLVGAAVAVCLSSLSANAATVTQSFNFLTGSPWTERADTLNFTSGALTLAVSATQYVATSTVGDAVDTTTARKVSRTNGFGLYVDYWGDNDHRIDGYYNELVKFVFNRDVTINKVTFGSIKDGSSFDLFLGDALEFVRSAIVTPTVNFADAASAFAIGASEDEWIYVCKEKRSSRTFRSKTTVRGCDCDKVLDYSAFKITSLEVSYDVPSEVPLPAAGWMLLAGLGGIGALRARKRS
jgi:hypothetical protein